MIDLISISPIDHRLNSMNVLYLSKLSIEIFSKSDVKMSRLCENIDMELPLSSLYELLRCHL